MQLLFNLRPICYAIVALSFTVYLVGIKRVPWLWLLGGTLHFYVAAGWSVGQFVFGPSFSVGTLTLFTAPFWAGAALWPEVRRLWDRYVVQS